MVARMLPSVADPSRNCVYCHQALQGNVFGHESGEGTLIHEGHEQCIRRWSVELLHPVCSVCGVDLDPSGVFSYTERMSRFTVSLGENHYVISAIHSAIVGQDLICSMLGAGAMRLQMHLMAEEMEICLVPLGKTYALVTLAAGCAVFHSLPRGSNTLSRGMAAMITTIAIVGFASRIRQFF